MEKTAISFGRHNVGSSGIWVFKVFRVLLLVVCVAQCVAEKVRYDGYQVLRVTPKTENELNILRDLEQSVLGEQLSFWKESSYVNNPVDIMVSPTLREDVVGTLSGRGIFSSAMIENVQDLIDEEEANLNPYAFDYNTYNSYKTIQQWMNDLSKSNPNVTNGSIGTSYEGRNINYLKIAYGTPKPAIVFNGGMHAREWITPATVVYLAKYLSDATADADDMLRKFDFYIIPIVNPDGYEYSRTNERLWRKTRKRNPGVPFCVGTDPNRNFATGWGGPGSSPNPCSNTYRGRKAFSEPETAALRDFVSGLGSGNNSVAMYIDYHAYSQFWLTPYGFNDSKPNNYNDQFEGAEAACNALKGVNGTEYEYGSITDVIYQASGGSNDYFFEGQGVPYSYALEGRDKGNNGFLLPKEQIEPSAKENWAALKAVCNYIYAKLSA